MTRADRVLSTPPTNPSALPVDPTRRRFLAQAAVAAAGGAALGVALPLPGLAGGLVELEDIPHGDDSDPIYLAIQGHKIARAALDKALDWCGVLDRELPFEKCQSRITAWQEVIVETDDPRWIECERAIVARMAEEDDAAHMLLTVLPTTMDGAVALLRYAVNSDTNGERWPLSLESEDGIKRSWQHFLIANMAGILPELAKRA